MKLVIVDTPAQAKLLTDALGEGWRVEPCYGFVRHLPDDTLGIAADADFEPSFVIARGKGNVVRRLMKALRESEAVYAALPPGRVGETMAWHLLALSPDVRDKPVYRVSLEALSSEAIQAAFAAPRPLNRHWVDAEVTAHIVDHLVGYSIIANPKISYDAMIALRLLAQQERARESFTPHTHWNASIKFLDEDQPFTAHVLNTKGLPLVLRQPEQAMQLEALFKNAVCWVEKTRERVKSSPAPDVLNRLTLLEAANSELGLPPGRTWALATTLYEAGWITYPSANAAEGAPEYAEATRTFIRREYGTEYLLPEQRQVSGIAPTDVNRIPEDLPGDGARLYALIWRRWVAAQMSPARHSVTTTLLRAGTSIEKPYPLELLAHGQSLTFDGWQRVIAGANDDEPLPPLVEGLKLHPTGIHVATIATEPPAYYTETSLVQALCHLDIAAIAAISAVEQLLETGYAATIDGALRATASGREVAEQLQHKVGELTSVQFRALLSLDMEQIAAGKRSRVEVLQAVWRGLGSPAEKPEGEHTTRSEQKPVVLRPAEEG